MYIRNGTTAREMLVQPLQWWAESDPFGWDRVKVSENLGATRVAPVALTVTSLNSIYHALYCLFFQKGHGFGSGGR